MVGIAVMPAPARVLRAFVALLACAAFLAALASPAAAQKEKKKKKEAATATDKLSIPMLDEQQIDYKISEMLGAWQLGDTDRLHQAYADDAVFVSGLWAPPVFGWSNYLPLYQQQRARMQQVRLDRVNTFIKVSGAVGWACYQWDFGGTVDGQPMTSRGQTTLVFEKRNDRWLIVHNHTSIAQAVPAITTQPQQPAVPANTPQQQPSKPPTS
ncbi:MAG TPA: nuclear transport factor 2 family protein [Candidatus Acidoferrum sp.]|nr:nuclear transport factor 2 family protein [Candidatus Acidoferrum sp.]